MLACWINFQDVKECHHQFHRSFVDAINQISWHYCSVLFRENGVDIYARLLMVALLMMNCRCPQRGSAKHASAVTQSIILVHISRILSKVYLCSNSTNLKPLFLRQSSSVWAVSSSCIGRRITIVRYDHRRQSSRFPAVTPALMPLFSRILPNIPQEMKIAVKKDKERILSKIQEETK